MARGSLCFIDAPRRLGEGGQEIAALKGPIGEVGLGQACRRRSDGGGCGAAGLRVRRRLRPAGGRRRRGGAGEAAGRGRRAVDFGTAPGPREERRAAPPRAGRPPRRRWPRDAGVMRARPSWAGSARRAPASATAAARPRGSSNRAVPDGDEIGARRRQGAISSRLAGIGDARNLEQFRPPGDPLDHGVERWPAHRPRRVRRT